jgi:DNA-binding response OmpR family regulator
MAGNNPAERQLCLLVVEDDEQIRTLLAFAFQQKGFACDTAVDGGEGEELVRRRAYDAVITDLRMPNKHGHALATYLLTLTPRPVIVVQTALVEPLIARDLLARCVDDVVFKPYDLGVLILKVRGLIERRAPPPKTRQRRRVRHDAASTLDPPRSVAAEVLHLIRSEQAEAARVAEIIGRDQAFASKVLHLANSTIYNPSGQLVFDLRHAVTRLGQRRIGEMAVAMDSSSTPTDSHAKLLIEAKARK